MILNDIKSTLHDLANADKAKILSRYFKTGKGEYGEGDLFLGVKVPDQRAVAKEFYAKISLPEIGELLSSQYHEHRLTALFMLISKFEKTKNTSLKDQIALFYLNNLKGINNWDLVDSSCYKILGRYAFENQKEDLLIALSESEDL